MACSIHQCPEAPAVAINLEPRLFSSRPRVNGSTRDDVSYLNQDHTARTDRRRRARSALRPDRCGPDRPAVDQPIVAGHLHRLASLSRLILADVLGVAAPTQYR